MIRTVETLLTMSFKLLELALCPSPSDPCINTLVAGKDSFKGGDKELLLQIECSVQISTVIHENKQYYSVFVFLIPRRENDKTMTNK